MLTLSFLTNFSRKPFTVNEQIKLIRDFLAVGPDCQVDLTAVYCREDAARRAVEVSERRRV